jgi:hypothetical protein
MVTICSSETSVNSQRTTWPHIPEDITLHTIDCMFPCMRAYFRRAFVLCVNHSQSPCSSDISSTYGCILLNFRRGSVQPTIWLRGRSLLCFPNDNIPYLCIIQASGHSGKSKDRTCILCSVKRSYLHVMSRDKSETLVCVNLIILTPVLRNLNSQTHGLRTVTTGCATFISSEKTYIYM